MFYRLRVICSLGDGTEKKLVLPGFNGNFFREDDQDDLVEKLIEVLDDPANCEVIGENSRQIIDNEINIHTGITGFRSALSMLSVIKESPMRAIVRALAPPIFLQAYRKVCQKRITFRGRYETWQEARKHSSGYDADAILDRVRDAMRKVRSGLAVCERDSVLFDTPLYPFPLIATLLRAALEHDGRLTVLDFGGSLASSYYQCRDFLSGVRSLRWCVVEQPKFVACGKQEFQTDVVRFYENVESCVKEETPTVILMSGVLQYLPAPLKILEEVSHIGAPFIIIDRTPVVLSGQQAISVQHVPSSIIRSSYPIWLFNEERLKAPLQGLYDEIATFPTVDGEMGEWNLKARFIGVIFQRAHRPTISRASLSMGIGKHPASCAGTTHT